MADASFVGAERGMIKPEGSSLKEGEEIKELIGGSPILLGTPLACGLEASLAKHFGVNCSTIRRDEEAPGRHLSISN
jgi:hypothetical protein